MKMTQETDVLKCENDHWLVFQEMRQRVREAAEEGQAIHEVERVIWQQVLRIGRMALGEFLRLQGTGDMGETVRLPDGQTHQRLEELHPRRYMSIFGEFVLPRTVYGSRERQKIEFVPLDNRLQLPGNLCSYVLQDWDQSLCAEQAFVQANSVIAKILGLKQSVDTLEHMNVEMAELATDFREERALPCPEEEGEIIVTSTDGKGIVMRRRAGEKAPRHHRTKGEKASRKEMATVGTVYSVDRYVRTPEEVVAALFADEPKDKEKQRPKPCHKQVIANLACVDEEGEHSGIQSTYEWMVEEIWRRNRYFPKEMVHLCDGQEALWDACWDYLPRCNMTCILDFLHVMPRLWQAAHLFHPEGSEAAEAFVRQRALKILHGDVALVVRGLREMGTKRGLTGNKKRTLTKLCNYLENNQERMQYAEYLAKGYPIASGVIEGACRHLVKDRMERAGMHWTRVGAQAMLNVRSLYVNGDWEEYQSYRIDREIERLYPFRELCQAPEYSMAG
jgi:hypothetical protein